MREPSKAIFNSKDPSESFEIPRNSILFCYRGSIAHGMYVPSTYPNSIDDVDLMGFVVGDEEHYFGLKEWGSRGTREIKQGRYDTVLYEVRKAVSLLLHGNPNILGMLWTRPAEQIFYSESGHELVANRHLFVGKHVYASFAGYAAAQMEKMETRDPAELREYLAVTAELKRRGCHPNHKGENFDIPRSDTGIERDVTNWGTDILLARLRTFQRKGENIGYMGEKRKRLVLEHGYDAKNAAHLIRLLRMAKEFLATGELQVHRADAKELLEIKRGGWSLEKIKAHAEELFAQTKEARDKSRLPDGPDREGAQRLLISIVKQELDARGGTR